MKRVLSVLLFLSACGTPADPAVTIPPSATRAAAPGQEPIVPVLAAATPADLPLGSQLAEDVTGSGWGAALTCKPVPDLVPLPSPRITLSVDGLTLHLVDKTTGFDKVYPVGAGEIEDDETSPNFGESKSYEPLLSGKQDYAITPSSIQPCKTWWTDPDTGAKSPVFAGLPFMSWNGAYAVHGPIDGYRSANGGTLRRGFVSHGCFRMEAADVVEVYALIKGVASTPVHVQREPERSATGHRIDLPMKWVGAECAADVDCNYNGGYCAHNAYSDRGFCSAHCTTTCADRASLPPTFCVADPNDATRGMCVPKMIEQDEGCRNLDHFVGRTVSRYMQTVTATACVPGSPGWIGDHCLAEGDCMNGTSCKDGICTEACSRFCPDEPGSASTFCAVDTTLGSSCLRSCTPASNASECPADSTCVSRHRAGDPLRTANVCVPS